MKFVSKENLELFAAKLKEQGGSSKASEIDTESATAGQLLGTDGNGNTEWESPMTDSDVDMLFIEKGTILKMNLDGTERQYRVLKNVSGSVFEVLGLFDLGANNFSTGTSVNFSDGTSGAKYADSLVDTALNTTWYNTLSATAKEALVDKNITQKMWYSNDEGNPDYVGVRADSISYTISLKSGATCSVGNRHIYALSVQDVIDYLEVTPQMTASNTTLTAGNILSMFQQTSGVFWTVDSAALYSNIMVVNLNGGQITNFTYVPSRNHCPAFQIDLSKITYTEV